MKKIYVVLQEIEDEFHIFEFPHVIHENNPFIKLASPIYKKAEDFAKKLSSAFLCEYEVEGERLVNGVLLKEFNLEI